jgi:serine/threonine protein kinase
MPRSGLLKYHITGTLWVGQTSIVYRATDAHRDQVVVKMLLPDMASSRRAAREMEYEARLTLRMDHPGIVKAIEFVRDAPMPALVMEHFNSENLKMHIVHRPETIREHAEDIILQVCESLGYVHDQGLVHRDVKPENVLVNDDGETKIIDFALAVPTGKGRPLGFLRRRIAGTRPYIAPETIKRKAPDVRTDIYSLGITIYEMLTGRPPFTSGDRDEILRKHLTEQPVYMRTHDGRISPRMDELVLQMLSKNPAQRPEDTREVVRRMRDIKVFDK